MQVSLEVYTRPVEGVGSSLSVSAESYAIPVDGGGSGPRVSSRCVIKNWRVWAVVPGCHQKGRDQLRVRVIVPGCHQRCI